ncbi:MAG: PAS domain S-box protein, partial [Candidatus Electrothrix sp. AR3]|nr:PAS domain S-box protein [Candidatus Electrothrix sp. AR3]
MNFFKKLLFSFLLLGLIGLSLSGVSSYLGMKEKLRQDAFNRLITLRDNRAKIVEYYFSQKRSQVYLLAKSLELIQATEKFRSSVQTLEQELDFNDITQKKIFRTLEKFYQRIASTYPIHSDDHQYSLQPRILPSSTLGKILQSAYTAQAINDDTLEMEHFTATSYSKIHEKYHPTLKKYVKQFGFYDFFIIDTATGVITYSVKKEIDYGTSLLHGPYHKTNLAKIFIRVEQATEPSAAFIDFAHYTPSQDLPASFFAFPIYHNNKKIGVFAAQLSIDELDNVLSDNRQWAAAGLGKTGETYLVGSDYCMRNNSRFLLEDFNGYLQQLEYAGIAPQIRKEVRQEKTTILQQQVQSNTIMQALEGQRGVEIITDYRGKETISAFCPLNISGVNWILLAKMDATEVFQELAAFRTRFIVISLVFLGIIILFSSYMAHVFTRPITHFITEISKFGSKTIDHRIKLSSNDECAAVADAFNRMAEELQEKTVSLDYFDMIVTSMTDMLLVIDVSQKDKKIVIRDANQAACQILEYERDEIIGLPFEEIFIEESLPDLVPFEAVQGIERTYLSKSGRKIPVLFSISTLGEKEFIKKGFVTIAQEISELQNARSQMQEQIQLLSLGKDMGIALTRKKSLHEMLDQCCRLLVLHLDAAFARIWLVDEGGSTLTLKASAGMHTYINGKHSRKPICDDNKIGNIALTKNAHITNNIIDDPQIHDQEWVKQERMVAFAGQPLVLEDKVIGVVALFSKNFLSDMVMKSMTVVADEIALGVQRKLAEASLIASEKLHKKAQEIAQIGHWELNLSTNALKWSEEQYKIFEIDHNKFTASYEAFLHTIHPDDREYVNKTYSESVKNRTVYDIVHRILCKDKRIKYLHERCRTEYDHDGKALRSTGTTQDITALKEAELENEKIEDRFRQAQKMEAIGTLAGGIAHDFNNLLNAIIGYSDILLMELPKGCQQQQYAVQINNAGNRATKLVNQILTFSRRTEQECQPIQIQLIVKEAMKLLRSTLPTTIEIRQRIGDGGYVIADSTQIHQIIMNL